MKDRTPINRAYGEQSLGGLLFEHDVVYLVILTSIVAGLVASNYSPSSDSTPKANVASPILSGNSTVSTLPKIDAK